jgi:hypothetical protein
MLLLGPAARASPVQNADGDGESPPLVVELIIDGVEAIDESELRATLSTRESPWLPWRPKQ